MLALRTGIEVASASSTDKRPTIEPTNITRRQLRSFRERNLIYRDDYDRLRYLETLVEISAAPALRRF